MKVFNNFRLFFSQILVWYSRRGFINHKGQLWSLPLIFNVENYVIVFRLWWYQIADSWVNLIVPKCFGVCFYGKGHGMGDIIAIRAWKFLKFIVWWHPTLYRSDLEFSQDACIIGHFKLYMFRSLKRQKKKL